MKAVDISYEVVGVQEFQSDEKFDAIGLFFVHFPVEIRKQAHQHLLGFLKTGGHVILEGFAKAQLGNASGGPKNKDMLFSIEDIQNDFQQLEFELLQEITVELSEGNHHKGIAEVIRFVGKK